jgi:serine/threonine protein kinase/tetratricopeptide (TPR) repeat protein
MPPKCSKCGFENQDGAVFCAKCATKLGTGGSGTGAKFSITRTLETTPEGMGKGELFAGRFELIEELGAGGMGIVYRAYDKKVGEEIALKILHPEIALDERTVDRFRNEIKLARRISHRNVCRMHELHEDGKTLFITMEYVSGQDLKGLIRETKGLTAGKAISIAKQVAEGLCEAHNLGVIHRDLKPQNIMVDKEGTAKIMDFGIARSLRAAGMTAEGMIIGTPEYMAPEQVEGLEADQRTDIYAMGAILFEMVTGRVPFEGDSPLSVAYKHKNEIPIPPRKLNAEIPEPFNKLILTCLEKEKDNRYQTAEELLADLIRIEEGLPISERVALPARPTIRIAREKPTGMKRLLVPALGVLVLALAAFIALRVLPKKPASPASASGKPSIAVLYFENLTGDPVLNYLKTGLTKLLTIGLEESKLVWVLDENSTYGILKKHRLDEASKYTREDLVKIADEGGVKYTASGSLMKAGESIIIMLTIQKPQSGEVAASIKVTCQNEAEIYPKIDELVAKIKSGMNLSAAQLTADAGRGIQQVTTSSPEAMKYYLEGLNYYNRVEYPQVKALCEKAIALDPNFALPYMLLATAYELGLGDWTRGRECRDRAYELRDRLPERDRYLVEAAYYEFRGENFTAKVIEAYLKYLELAPRDADALQSLGVWYRSAGDNSKYLEYHEKGYQAKPVPALLGVLLVAYQRTGKLDRAEEVLKDYYKNYQDNSIIQKYSSYFYIVRKNFRQALAEIERGFLQEPSPASWSWDNLRGDVYLAQGDLAAAEKEYLRVIEKAEKPKYISDATLNLIRLHILQGKMSRGTDELAKATAPGGAMQGAATWGVARAWTSLGIYDKALEIFEAWLKSAIKRELPELIRTSLLNKGSVDVSKKEIGEAEKIAEELRISGQKSSAWDALYAYQTLRGLIDLDKGDYAKAVESLGETSAWYDSEAFYGVSGQAWYFYPLALAYYKSGNLPKARTEFERLTNLTAGRWDFGDLYAKGFYWLGKIAEEEKDKRRAAENYGKFLDLWKDADPGQPELDDAKARLAALK